MTHDTDSPATVEQRHRDAAQAFWGASIWDFDLPEHFARFEASLTRAPDGLAFTADRGSANSHCMDDQLLVNGECIGFLREEWTDRILAALAERAALTARCEALEGALRPFACADFETPITDDEGWTEFGIGWCRDRIVDWFGPSDFRAARTALKEAKS